MCDNLFTVLSQPQSENVCICHDPLYYDVTFQVSKADYSSIQILRMPH